jgi:hypothetical protein
VQILITFEVIDTIHNVDSLAPDHKERNLKTERKLSRVDGEGGQEKEIKGGLVEMSKIGLERLFVRSSVALGTSRSNDRFRTIRDGHNI